MKKLILFSITVTLCSCVTWQTVSFSSDDFVKVYEIQGSQSELFLKANDWMVRTFKDATSVIQHSDKQEGVVIGKYLIFGSFSQGMYGGTVDSRVYAIIDIRVKDGKARLMIQPNEYAYGVGVPNAFTKEKALERMEALAVDFESAMNLKKVEF